MNSTRGWVIRKHRLFYPRLKSDLIEVILKLMAGEKPELDWDPPRPMLGVVVACDGYPQDCAGRPRLGGQCLWPLPIFIFITVEWRRAVGGRIDCHGRAHLSFGRIGLYTCGRSK